MEKKRSIKTKNILRVVIWILILSFVVICVCYLSWAALFRPVQGNQPELSIKEKKYFNEMEEKERIEPRGGDEKSKKKLIDSRILS